MHKPSLLLLLLLAVCALTACGPRPESSISIEAPLSGSALTEGTHNVSVHGFHAGEVGLVSLSYSHPGFVYVRYAKPPGEPLEGTYIANFEWIADGELEVDIPFPFLAGDPPQSFNGEYSLQACLLAGPPQYDVIVCTDILIYMPDCGPDEVSLGNDCIPAAVDATATPTAAATAALLPEVLVAIPQRDVNCRLGPSASQFEIDDTLFQGVEYTPVAVGHDALWLMFIGPVSTNPCWVFVDNLDLSCNGESFDAAQPGACNLAVETYPPTPTATSTPLDIVYATATELPPQSVDGLDNDGDGLTDYQPAGGPTRGDQQCTGQTDNDESK